MSVTGADSLHGGKVTSRNATDETARAGLIRSRNLHRIDYRLLAAARKEALEQVERTRLDVEKGADFFEFLKALREHDVPEEVEAKRRVDEANRAARLCGQCGRCLDDREAVYIAPRVYAGIAVLARKPKFYRAPVCGGCAPVDISERKDTYGDRTYNVYVDEPCGGCARPVVLRTTYGLYNRRRCVFCCERCRWAFYNTARNERSARARDKVCEVCGEAFTATRRDAKTCSRACKQKAHRARRKGVISVRENYR